MGISKDEFLRAALDAASSYPTLAQYVKARDPRVMAQLEAQATMLAMLSAQLDVAKYEPFVKARDATVMADASLKGILPLGRACKVTLSITNSGDTTLALGAQRHLVDPKGRLYELDTAASIAPGAALSVTATQIRRRSVSAATVDAAADFYSLQVDLSSDEMCLNTLAVYQGSTEFKYAPDWFNVKVDERAYQIEVDELRRMFVKFGKASVIGYGVHQGDVFTLDITECNGRISDLKPGGSFALEYIYAAGESDLQVSLVSVQDEGAAPHSLTELRVMSRYPAIYDHNAVYLGEFEFLLRRYISGVRFLAVWNEQIEENVRGPSVDNINALFVSGLVTGLSDAAFQARVTELFRRADDSYRVSFVPAVLAPVPLTVTASIAISWDRATVESQIRALLLEQYGDGSVSVSQGLERAIKKSAINKLLRERIDALRDDRAEFEVSLTLPATALPEQFVHISPASLTVAVSSVDYGVSLWNY